MTSFRYTNGPAIYRKSILKELGHEIFILSGSYRKDVADSAHEELIPNLSFFSPNCEWEQNRAFFFPPDDPHELLRHLHSVSDHLTDYP